MLIYLLDENFEILLPTDRITSLQWNTKYYDAGRIEIHLPISQSQINDETLTRYKKTMYVYVEDNGCTGVVQQHEYTDGKYVMKGRTLEILLSDRVIDTQFNMTGKAEDVARALVDVYVINPTNQNRKIPNMYLGTYKGLGGIISYAQRGKYIDRCISDILYTQELSWQLRYDFKEVRIYFEVFQGIDRTQRQDINTWVVFSKDFGNIKSGSEKYTYSTNYKNYAYVLGANNTVVTVDQTNGNVAKELWIDSKNLTDVNELRTHGEQKLSEYQQIESVQFQIQTAADIVFSVGDICEYANNDLNITTEGRITEISEVWESSFCKKSIVLGEGQLTFPQKVKRELS